MNYTYDRYWGVFYSGGAVQGNPSSSKIVGVGYSGTDVYLNQPTHDNIRDVGCIPAGRYTFKGPRDDSKTGEYVFDLIPDPSNDMKGREDFQNHGDLIGAPGNNTTKLDHMASDGCIVSPRWTRNLWKDGDILDVI